MLTISVPEELAENLNRDACNNGVSVEDYVLRVLRERTTQEANRNEAVAFLQQWRNSADERDRLEPENDLLESLDAHRLSGRPLFPPELKGITW